MSDETVNLPGSDLNRLLEALSLKVERVSMLIDDAMVDQSDVIALDRSAYNDLMICLAKYEEFLKSLGEVTQDTTEEIRGIIGSECFTGEVDADEEIEIIEEDDDS
ncbi:MAG: hypothetical protein WBZ29_15035 [Methanocella sp.]